MTKSPAHYLDALLLSQKDTAPKRKGRATHAFLLGDEASIAVYPGPVRRGKQYDAFAAEHRGSEIMIASEMVDVLGMRDAVRRHPEACRLLFSDTRLENEVAWKIGERQCAGRIDSYAVDRIVELKSTMSAAPGRFPRQGRWLAYHAQLAWYRNGVRLCGLARAQSAYVVAVESSRPYPVTVFELTRDALEQGERLWRLWFEQLRVCEDSGHWPAYSEAIEPFDVDTEGTYTLTMGGEEVSIA
jgi:hypothetical protein